jgi:hypothetical protein
MAKGSGKGKKDTSDKDKKAKEDKKSTKAGKGEKRSKKDKKPEKPKREATKRPKTSPIKTPIHEPEMKDISALRSFLTSFLLFALLLAPVLGLGLYFAWDAAVDILPTAEDAFMAGMGAGIAVAFVIAVLFTRKAIATS